MTNTINQQTLAYGRKDASYQAAGGFDGLTKLVDAFYQHMQTNDFSKRIFDMHTADNSLSKEKLVYFLSGWLGGPRIYQEKYGSISIPGSHQHLDIGRNEKDAWLRCMRLAIAEQNYTQDFSDYLLKQLSVPANRVEMACKKK